MLIPFTPSETLPDPGQMKVSSFLKEWRVLPTFFNSLRRINWARAVASEHKAAPQALTLLVPGFGAGELTLEPLRRYLLSRGRHTQHWGLGINSGDPERDSQRLIARIEKIADQYQTISLVGWSLGGVIAREVARTRPDLIKQVFTLGTPVIGGPTYTLAAGYWGKSACHDIAKKIRHLDETLPITRPLVAFFTKNDGVVSWPACVDLYSTNVRHFEVNASHWAIGFNWHVWEKIYEML